MKKSIIIISIILIVGLFLAGCTQNKCPELDYSNCPQQKCPDLDCSTCSNQIETKTITKYVCANGLVMDTEDDCKKSTTQASGNIENAKIESIIQEAHSDNILSLVKYENNLLTVEYRSVYSTADYFISDHYQVVKDIINYVSDLNLEPNLKLTALNDKATVRRTSLLSWNDAQKLINFQMGYDEWENGLTSN